MKLSIIVPIYKGNQYIEKLVNIAQKNHLMAQKEINSIETELVLVNDYPDSPIETGTLPKDSPVEIVIINNIQNEGIHQSRINGLNACSGEYVVFLDQDDFLTDHFFLSQIRMIGENDMVIGNGYKMQGNSRRVIYRNRKKQNLAVKEMFFFRAANQIVSPGQCLIKKEAIPDEWRTMIVTANGGDDLFLWILMFEKHRMITVNPECVYCHVDTGKNVSGDYGVMYHSAYNVIDLMKACRFIDDRKIRLYKRRVDFVYNLQTYDKPMALLNILRYLDVVVFKFYAYYR